MRCFRWRTWACLHTRDLCRYRPRLSGLNITTSSHHATLFSPKHSILLSREDQSFGPRFFCVYNVSLNCPRKSVVIESTAETTWPKQQDASCRQSGGGCENYVAFYDDQNSKIVSHEFHGQRNYRHVLSSDSFLAVMWTSEQQNNGIFEFLARCNDQG